MKRRISQNYTPTSMHTVQKDLIAMERHGLIKKAGYEYNRAGDPEQRYELTQAGNDKFWAFELAHLSDADKATLERRGYDATAQGLKLYIEETQP
jgi:DNA-binding HxlR family transcriptional regulator